MVEVPPIFSRLWQSVISIREHLRSKRQALTALAAPGPTIHVNRAHTTLVLPERLSSSVAIRRTDSVDGVTSIPGLAHISHAGERRKEIHRILTAQSIGTETELVDRRSDSLSRISTEASSLSIRELMQQGDAQYKQEEEWIANPVSFEDYLDQLLQKLALLMNLNPPWNLNEGELTEEMEEEKATMLRKGVKKPSSVIAEDVGIIPESREELIMSCVRKYLLHSNSVSVAHLHDSLQNRTANARAKHTILEEALQFLRIISPFAQATRLFLLGLRHEMTVCSHYYIGGYHDRKRLHEGAYVVDYLENCEGASLAVSQSVVKTLEELCVFLGDMFSTCVENLQWRLGGSILWFIMTATSPKLPYFHHHINLANILEENTLKLNKIYEKMNGYSRDLLLSPGAFWDSLSQKPITLAESHFHHILQELTRQGSTVNTNAVTIPGIYPPAIMGLANIMRLSYTLLLVYQFTDYPSRSIHSPAQDAETLFHWTLTDMANLFIRLSSTYFVHTRMHFLGFMRFFGVLQDVMEKRSKLWLPFAPINYSSNDTDTNLYTCVEVVDPKNFMRGMIATDMLISAGEGLLSSYLALTLFIVRTRLSVILPWADQGNLLWKMLYFSPRNQKLTLMLFQYIIPETDFFPSVFQQERLTFPQVPRGLSDMEAIMNNPFLQPPYFPRTNGITREEREAFVYFLLHLVSHADSCPASLVGERSSCSLCCTFFPFIYNTICRSSPAFSLPEKAQLIRDVEGTTCKAFVSTCKMHIRQDGHTAAFNSLVFAEEVVYLLRMMLRKPAWASLMQQIFQDVLDTTVHHLLTEQGIGDLENADNHGFHVILRRRTPWFCMSTAVLKVLGAITPRMYAGSRIRIHEFLMDGENMSSLIHTAYQSHGTGTIIKYNRSMSEALVLMDKIETPRLINCYVFDVVDRVEPPRDTDSRYAGFLSAIQAILSHLPLHPSIFDLPTPEMPFFNTSDLSLMPSEIQNCILYLYSVRCLSHLIISNQSLAIQILPSTIQQLMDIAVRPLPCNISFNTLIIRQYFNLIIEYLIDTYPGSARLLPMELQTDDVEEGSFSVKADLSASYGVGKEERYEKEEGYGRPSVIRYERRMRMAAELAEKAGLTAEGVYRILQVRVDEMN